MKKVLAGLICVVMCLSGVSALAHMDYSDVPEEYVKVTDLLYELEIMEGDDEGKFNPDDTLTRAEAAAIMVRLLGKDNWVSPGEASFTDVESTHWAADYIYRAEANGIINGMGDGIFEPDSTVTYHQFVKMLVCVLGYKTIAEAHGGFCGGGYLYVGSAQVTGFTKGVPGKAEDTITRLTAARLVYNALEVEIFEEWTYDATMEGWCIDLPDYKTILEDYLGCEKIHGVITNCIDNNIEVVITKNVYDDYDINYIVGQKFTFTDKTRNAKDFIGYTIIAYVKKTNDADLFLVTDEKAGKNNKIAIDTNLIKEFTSEKVVYYKSEGGKRANEAAIESYVYVKKEEVAVSCNVIVNGKLNPDFDVYENYKTLDEITFLDNDNDGNFEFIIVNTEK